MYIYITYVVNTYKNRWKAGSGINQEIFAYKHVHMHTYRIYIYVCTIYTHIYLCTIYIYTHIYTFMHTYIHTHILRRRARFTPEVAEWLNVD